MKITKKVLSILLSFMLVLGVCAVAPIIASAADVNLKVCGVEVTDDNKDDVLEDGTVSFDFNTSTLSLNNAYITAAIGYAINAEGTGNSNLTIILRGTNYLECFGGDYAIHTRNINTTIDGSQGGTLNCGGRIDIENAQLTITNVSGLTVSTNGYGVFNNISGAEYGLKIKDSTVTVTSDDNTAIRVSGSPFMISGNSFVTAQTNSSSSGSAMYYNSGLVLEDGLELLCPEGGRIFSSIVNADGTAATKVIIGKKAYSIGLMSNPDEGGTVSGGGTYNYGGTATVTATSNTDYHFINWTENGNVASTEANYTFTVTEDRSLVANFAPDTHTVPVTAIISANDVVRGDKLTWNITTPADVTWLKFTGEDESGNTYTSYYKYSNYNKGTTEASVTDTDAGRVWNIPMVFNYVGTQAVDNQTWTIEYRVSGSNEWKSAPGEPFNIKVGKNAAVLAPAPEEGEFAPYSILTAVSADREENGAVYKYFYITTTDDVSKVKISFINADTGKTKSATYQTTSTNVVDLDTANGFSVWTIRMKVTAQAQDNAYTVHVRGPAWGEGMTAIQQS